MCRHCLFFKQAQRREDDIAIVTGAFFVAFQPESGNDANDGTQMMMDGVGAAKEGGNGQEMGSGFSSWVEEGWMDGLEVQVDGHRWVELAEKEMVDEW